MDNCVNSILWLVSVKLYHFASLSQTMSRTVGTESIQTPLDCSLFVSLQTFAKIQKKFILFHTLSTEKNRNVEMFANLLKKKTYFPYPL